MALSTPGEYSDSNMLAKRIPRLYLDLGLQLILVVGGIEKFDMDFRRQESAGHAAADSAPTEAPAYCCFNCLSMALTISFESGVTLDSKRCTT